MKIRFCLLLLAAALLGNSQEPGTLKLSRAQLADKIKGGWAGQTIGVTFGGPYEFQFNGTFIGDYQSLKWYDGYIKRTMTGNPGLYDDLYMDLTFVDVFEKHGLDAPADSFAHAFAQAGYPLWHANQAGRYNVLRGIRAPMSGHWQHNPHADCIDYQIEADFAGLMSPGMPNTASAIGDRIGHIMNYGDGWYGGIYVSAMYALAFTSSDINHIVRTALNTVPKESEFHQCIADVIRWHRQYPSDWKQTWLEVQKKWADDIGCPEGVFVPLNIDAKVNAAYVVIGLLYGGGDYTKTLEISTRCGQDADCNPSTAAGILGTVLGYNQIPAYWKMGLQEAESIDFKYTTMSLEDVYATGLKHALANIERNGGRVHGGQVTIKLQSPQPVRFEKSFAGLYPLDKIWPRWSEAGDELHFEFEGTGFVIRGDAARWASTSPHVFRTELYVDGRKVQDFALPASFLLRSAELAWKYDLPKGRHTVQLKLLNPLKSEPIYNVQVLLYSDKPVYGLTQHTAQARKP
ncbi:MAG TPA: ADP-ribosylglycohydrolase family protein [Chitinophagaceae bacterium]|nr:ADP-ribosylglycohydrolase family protein [Chitinophagaceae bacterium]